MEEWGAQAPRILTLAMGPEARLGTMYEHCLYPFRTHRRALMAYKQREPSA